MARMSRRRVAVVVAALAVGAVVIDGLYYVFNDLPRSRGRRRSRGKRRSSWAPPPGSEEARSIRGRVFRIVSEQLEIPYLSISLASNFVALGADSLDQVELIMEFE